MRAVHPGKDGAKSRSTRSPSPAASVSTLGTIPVMVCIRGFIHPMKISALWASAAFFIALLTAASLLGGGFAKPPTPDVLAVTDVTDEGRSWPLPEPGKPVYYEAISFGSRNFPAVTGDVEPNSRAMLRLILRTLAEQGYKPATEKGVAKVFLSISWGYSPANLGALRFLGGEKLDLMWELDTGGMITPNVFRRNFRSLTAEKVMSAANNDLYIASIQAFDLEKINAGKKVLLWHTHVACSTGGLSMADALPSMIVAAGPFIGRETQKPVWRDVAELRKAHVDFGALKIMEYIEPSDRNKGEDGPQKK